MLEALLIPIAQAAAAGGGADHPASSGLPQFDTSTFSSQTFWSIVSFLILVALLNKYVIPAIRTILDARGKAIQEEIDSAKKSRTDADKALAEYRQLISSARESAAQIMDEARREAILYRDSAIKAIEEEGSQKKAAVMEEIEQGKRAAMQEISRHAVDIALLATEKLLARSVTAADASQMVDEAIHQIEQQRPSIH
ncbi:MAG: F0F1 ATP synthase subunit B [Magnetococcales bacterium]|nr:F0F1 ATP synthase subunit B [Magnetococcales bacterium]